MAAESERGPAGLAGAATEAERSIAWLRIVAVPLIASAVTLPHPDPERGAFVVAAALLAGFAVAALVWVYVRPVTRRFVLAATVLDVSAVTALTVLSGGGYSAARLAYFVIPVAVAFRFRPALTAAASATTVVAYLAQALAHPAGRRPGATQFIAVQAGFLVWVGLAAVLLSALLSRRTAGMARLADARRQLIADSLSAAERERKALAEGLHDHAIQNLLSARLDLEEVSEQLPHPALERADEALAATVRDLREAVFELHPYILEQAGLEAALRSLAQQTERRAGVAVRLELDAPHRHANDGILLAAARELLANAGRHAQARTILVRLAERNGTVTLEVQDDGRGFDPADLPGRLAEGHIGLPSQQERVESLGGRMLISTAPGSGTSVEIRVPS